MNDYIQQIKFLTDQLATCGSTVTDDDIILLTLDGLPPSHCQFCSSVRIRAKSADLSLTDLHTLLICEEISVAEESSPDPTMALLASRPFRASNGCGSSHRGHTNNLLVVVHGVVHIPTMACCLHQLLHHLRKARINNHLVILLSIASIGWTLPIKVDTQQRSLLPWYLLLYQELTLGTLTLVLPII
ncbi:hypothetical protein NE237_002793 [Protea cynaroides]|uniref:Uncharacterized protein n=1 Tax=Protea cynaroides TaxID=273540 RepID=A0A9Q0KFV3_9MAGN|nr:hypothetical protein NE237_002793 [Protea cynaroides]